MDTILPWTFEKLIGGFLLISCILGIIVVFVIRLVVGGKVSSGMQAEESQNSSKANLIIGAISAIIISATVGWTVFALGVPVLFLVMLVAPVVFLYGLVVLVRKIKNRY